MQHTRARPVARCKVVSVMKRVLRQPMDRGRESVPSLRSPVSNLRSSVFGPQSFSWGLRSAVQPPTSPGPFVWRYCGVSGRTQGSGSTRNPDGIAGNKLPADRISGGCISQRRIPRRVAVFAWRSSLRASLRPGGEDASTRSHAWVHRSARQLLPLALRSAAIRAAAIRYR